MSFGARALIRLGALTQNFQAIRKKSPGARIMAVVKANAYGHGLLQIARGLPDVDSLAVARLQEALALRADGIEKPLVLLEGVFSERDMAQAVEQRCELVVHCDPQIELLEATAARDLTVWMKVDSGMNRLGFELTEAKYVLQRLKRCPAIGDLRLMTHLASADLRSDSATPDQLHAMAKAIPEFDGDVSIANSAGLFAWQDALSKYYECCTGDAWVRPGIALYGISPFAGQTGPDLGLKPVMQLETRLISVKQIRKGERVGYLGRWEAQEDTTIGIVAAGYGDGYLRYLPSGTPLLINGRRVPLAGLVSMDMAAVDLGPDASDRIGDFAILWGEDLLVEEIAAHAGTIPYQLVTGVTHREPSEQTN